MTNYEGKQFNSENIQLNHQKSRWQKEFAPCSKVTILLWNTSDMVMLLNWLMFAWNSFVVKSSSRCKQIQPSLKTITKSPDIHYNAQLMHIYLLKLYMYIKYCLYCTNHLHFLCPSLWFLQEGDLGDREFGCRFTVNHFLNQLWDVQFIQLFFSEIPRYRRKWWHIFPL